MEVRSGWYAAGMPDLDAFPAEYTILLCTGGPAVRIIGELDQYGEPETARLEHQDWGTPWTEYYADHMPRDDQETALLTYARQFYYGG